ncbi:MAG TPA: hypothetical protein VGD91_29580 [Trebonia sp.]
MPGGTAAVLLVGQVGGHHADPPGRHALRAQQVAGLVQLSGGAGEQGNAGTGGAEPERDGPADTAASPVRSSGLAAGSWW